MFVSSSTTDADLFLVLRLFDPAGDEVLFHGANEPRAPIAQGWLRASHRKVDPARSRPWQPWHPHDEIEPLEPGRVYGVDVEIWPTSIVVPPGHRLGLAVLGRDFDHGLGGLASHLGPPMRGSAFFLHDDPRGRPPEIYDGEVTIHGGGDLASYLLLPVIQPPS
jgi:predicted acyl esterase